MKDSVRAKHAHLCRVRAARDSKDAKISAAHFDILEMEMEIVEITIAMKILSGEQRKAQRKVDLERRIRPGHQVPQIPIISRDDSEDSEDSEYSKDSEDSEEGSDSDTDEQSTDVAEVVDNEKLELIACICALFLSAELYNYYCVLQVLSFSDRLFIDER